MSRHKDHHLKGNTFNFNNFDMNVDKDVEFSSEAKNFKFRKSIIIPQMFLGNKNWLISTDNDNLYIKKLNKESGEYIIKFSIT